MVKWKWIERMYKIRKKNICRKTLREVCRRVNLIKRFVGAFCRILHHKGVQSGLAAVLTAFAVCVLSVLSGRIPAIPVMAASRTAVTLTAEGNQAEVFLEWLSGNQSEQQGYGGIKALQLGFQISILHGEGENYQVSFLFDEGITSSVKQFSYQEEIGLLQIYLSGEQNLFESGGITLGKIAVESNGLADVTASIRVAENSLKTVNDAFDLQELPFGVPEMVQVTTDGKQTGKDNSEDQSGSGIATGQSGSNEKPAGVTEPEAGGSGTIEQEPLLRLVETEKRGGFSPDHFSFRGLLADKRACIVLGVVAAAVVALVGGAVTRLVHNRKKKKKKWW